MIAKITIDTNNLITIEAPKDDLKKINVYFSYPDYSKCWIRGKFRKERVKIQKFLITSPGIDTTGLLPIGFLQELENYLKSQQATYKIFDNREIAKFNFTDEEIIESIPYLTLKSFQIEAIRQCLIHPNAIIKSPTASGKTEMFISLCKLMQFPTLILFARIDLAHQTMRRMKKAGLDAGIVQGNNMDENHLIVMATVQSSHKLQNQYKMVIIDECHKSSSDQFLAILKSNCFIYRYGFSATPFVKTNKLKNACVKSFIGDIVYEVKPEQLMAEERIARPTIYFIPVTVPKTISEINGWLLTEKLGIVENSYRNNLIAKLCSTLKGQTLILVVKINQGETLNQLIPNSHLLFGDIKVKERQEVVKEFESGKNFVLIASTIFDEGIDISNINNVIVCGGGASFIKTVQRLGRGLRVTETKKTVNIYDFYDYTNPLLEKHSVTRIKTYRHEGYKDIKILNNKDLWGILNDSNRTA